MKKSSDVTVEIDFVTCGLKPQGELFCRASEAVSNSEKLSAATGRVEDIALATAGRLVRSYVECQEIVFKFYNVSSDDWYARTVVRVFMTKLGLQKPLQEALKFRDQIETAANGSKLYTAALGIIHEYETYCSQVEKIKKHVKVQRKITNSNRAKLLIVLGKRDGLICQGCGLIENLPTDYKIDHIIPLVLGGYSNLENLQLLCGSCNSIKGNRSMAYLLERIDKRRRNLKEQYKRIMKKQF